MINTDVPYADGTIPKCEVEGETPLLHRISGQKKIFENKNLHNNLWEIFLFFILNSKRIDKKNNLHFLQNKFWNK